VGVVFDCGGFCGFYPFPGDPNKGMKSVAIPEMDRFVEEIPRKVGLFPIFQEQRRRISLQLRLHGGGR
jgi:hypothetical protein